MRYQNPIPWKAHDKSTNDNRSFTIKNKKYSKSDHIHTTQTCYIKEYVIFVLTFLKAKDQKEILGLQQAEQKEPYL